MGKKINLDLGACGARTRACSVHTRVNADVKAQGVEMSLDTARKSACATCTRMGGLDTSTNRSGWVAILILSLSALLSGAVILDRIAVIAGTHVIKTSDIERDIRLTDFLNRAPLDLKTSAKREAAERLITQEIIRDEIVSGGYRRPPEAEAVDLEAQLRRDRFGGSEQRLVEGLQHYGLTRAELRGQLLWQITVLQFIDERFRGGIVVTLDEVRDFYDGHYVELRQQYPKDNSFETLEPKIQTMLESQRINQSFNEWLDQARMNYPVEYKQAAFE
jgi:peptidyl-prolyl cis-trans isomerase SurA